MKKRPTLDFLDFDIYPLVSNEAYKLEKYNKQPIIIVTESLEEEELSFLEKIMSAVGKKISEDIFLIHKKDILYKDIKRYSSFDVLLIFGLAPKQIGLHINAIPYKISLFQEKKILFVDKLATIENNDNYKKQLWSQLQKLI